ncbi:hypothetical protein [Chryseobacterium sp.]|uniref:hypothetical protein n=1 Tax=Chryseobacterium sp. TaxID=1871047 RepID=UPI00321973E4
MKNLVLITVFIAIIWSLNSCVSFSRKMIGDDLSKLEKENIQMIDGEYEFKGYEHIRHNNIKSDTAGNAGKMLDVKNVLANDCDRLIIKSVPLAKDKTYEVQFIFLKGKQLQYTFKYQAQVKKGFLLLNNYVSQCHGIPYLLGGCQSSQSRMGLTKDHHLLIQNYDDNSGALLLFFWAGYTINYAEKYKRIH